MEKRTMLALFATIVVLFAFQMFFTPKEQPVTAKTKPEEQAAKAEVAKPSPLPAKGAPKLPVAGTAKIDVRVDTPLLTVVFTDLGGGIKSVTLNKYHQSVKGTAGKEIIEDIKPLNYIPAIVRPGDDSFGDRTNFVPSQTSLTVTDRPATLTFSGSTSEGSKAKKTYTFYPDRYTIDVAVEVEAKETERLAMELAVISGNKPTDYGFRGPFVYSGNKFEQIEKIEKPLELGKNYTYSGFDEGYFASIWIPQAEAKPDATILKKQNNLPVLRLSLDRGVASGTIFFGPKQSDVLKSLNVKAEKIVYFGWFDIIAKPLIVVLNFFNRVTRNYGIDIIILTILIKILFYPLSIKSFKSMKEMQKLQPLVAKLKEKYKDDKQKLNQEMMELYKKRGVNPMGGCLPMVIQIPVFFALYKALSGAIELRHAPFFLWINDLSAPEDLFTFFVAGYAVPIRILPLVMGATQLIQQKMTPTSADPMQEKMMLLMPIVFTFLFYGFSSGLVLYWLVNNVLSIAQQYYYNKKP
jgi:YidC/Oxa1 family membrane protein insertase